MASQKNKLELVGVFAVVLSLLLVAYELRQNTNIQAAQAVFELNQGGRESIHLTITEPELRAVYIARLNGLDTLTEDQRIMHRAAVLQMLNLYESAWKFHQRGIISDMDLEGWRVDYCFYMSIDAFREVVGTLNASSPLFRADAAQWCD